MNEKKMLIAYDRKRTSTLTLDEQPGAHTGDTRKYIPGYADSNIVYLDTASGNDSNDGSTELLAKLTYASAATAAGSTKKIRVINDGAALSTNITKPTEMKRGVSGTIGASTSGLDVFTQSGTTAFSGASIIASVCFSEKLKRWVAVGGSGKAGYSDNNGTTWTASSTLPASSVLSCVIYVPELSLFIATGGDGGISYSETGVSWTTVTIPDAGGRQFYSVAYSQSLGKLIAVGDKGMIFSSVDGVSWATVTGYEGESGFIGQTIILSVKWSNVFGGFILCGVSGIIYTSPDGLIWTSRTSSFGSTSIYDISENGSLIVAVGDSGKIAYSSNGVSWTQSATPSFGSDTVLGVSYSNQFAKFLAVGTSGKIAYSSNGNTWTQSGTPSFGSSDIRKCASRYGYFIAVGAEKIGVSNQPATTISASIAGFSINEAQYSGTVTAYNCTLNPGTTAALSLDNCRVNYDSHISNNAATSRATLYIGDRHTTCTPASQNAVDFNLDTVGGTWYIYNASQTGYERIRDVLAVGGIIANYAVTVGGRSNTQGLSENVLFGADVTHNDPKFVDTTDYALQFQTNGYARNSLAAGRSAIYFNSGGRARDIGAWSYVESAISFYFSKSAEIYVGFITHELEEVVSEQQGDSGEISVYGNIDRLKEAVVLNFPSSRINERAVFNYMRFIKDKTVKINVNPDWTANAVTVTVNGNQSAGVEFLTVDATAVFDGEWLTIAGKKYFIMRASPNKTAATKLILDRPLEDGVSDNDVISANYPEGSGEYQYAAMGKLNLARIDNQAFEREEWRKGFSVRFVRKASQ